MKVNNSRIVSIFLISFSLLYNSCSLVGLGIGAITDSSRPDPESKVINREDYETIKPAKKISIHLKDNTSKVGRFEEITDEYLILRTGGLKPRGKIERIGLDEILSVEIKQTSGKLSGFITGLAIDVLLIFIILSADFSGLYGGQ